MAVADALSRGQYSDAVLNELESQNDQQVEGIMGKVKVLKEVSLLFWACPGPVDRCQRTTTLTTGWH